MPRPSRDIPGVCPSGRRDPCSPSRGPPSKRNDPGDEAQRSAESLATLETAQRPCVQSPGLAWGTPSCTVLTSGPHVAALGAVVQRSMQRPTDTHGSGMRGMAESYCVVCRPGSSAAGGPWGVGQQPNRLRPVLRPRPSLEQPRPPDLLARAVSLNSEKEFDWE